MLVPAGIYIALNAGSPAAHGWGVPMATDIAFAVGILLLLGPRVPAALRVMLLALAIIDDIGAILVIALFYSSGIVWSGLLIAGLGIIAVILMQRVGLRHPFLYIAPGLVIWAGVLSAGIHPTIAGVIIGLLTPVRSWFGYEGFLTEIGQALDSLRGRAPSERNARTLLPFLERINVAQREAIPPVTRIEAALHPWVAFGIMPIFALANAGVGLGEFGTGESASTIAMGVGLGLVVGKPLGIFLFSWLAVRLGLASLPRGVGWKGVFGALAFEEASMLAQAKLTVLIASTTAGIVGLVAGFKLLPREMPPFVDGLTAHDAERSTEY
jgi:NhaA family Na+:H+ antiporter